MSKTCVSKALREVWAWKESSYREVAHLPTDKALREIMRRAGKMARTLGFYPTTSDDHRRSMRVAEEKSEYVAKKGRR